MATITAASLGDLITLTLPELGEAKFTQIASRLQNFPAAKMLLKKNKSELSSGTYVQWNVMVTYDDQHATWVGMYEPDIIRTGDVMKTASMQWKHITTNWAFDRREIAMNRTPRHLVDLMKVKRIDSLMDLTHKLETAFWTLPASTDDKTMIGIPYFLVKNATEGFTGTVYSGFTAVGGLSSTTYPYWTNYAGSYTLPSVDDLLPKWRKMAYETDWQPPVDGIPDYASGDKMGFYCNLDTILALEEVLRGQNDNLGTDLDKYNGAVRFRNTPVEYVSKLKADTENPVYAINWGDVTNFMLRGEWMKEEVIAPRGDAHTVTSVHLDCTIQPVMRNRRRSGVLATGVTAPTA